MQKFLLLLSTAALLPVSLFADTEAYGPKYASAEAAKETKEKGDAPDAADAKTKKENSGNETISSALESAYLSNPELAAAVAQVNQRDERVVQAKAGYRPRITGTMSLGVSKTSNRGESLDRGNSTTRTSETAPNASGRIEVSQNIYAGGATNAAVKGAENTVLAQRARLMAVEQNIFFQVIQSYLEILTIMSEVAQFEGNVKALTQSLAASNDRFKVGEETRTSVAQAEAQLEEGRAQLEDAKARLEAQHATFMKLTGRRARLITKPDVSRELPTTLEQAIQIGMENNPEVIEAKFQEAAAKYEVDRIGGGLLPQVDLIASTSRTETKNKTEFRNFTTANTRDKSTSSEAAVRLTVPIYEQGSTRSQKREAHELAAERRIGIETVRRRITENIITFWQNYLAAKANIEFFKSQVKAREVSLEGTRQEMQVGTKILLDVLNAQRDLLSAQLNLIRAERTFYLEQFRLLAGMGRLTAKQLKLKVNYYDPSIHYNETKSRI